MKLVVSAYPPTGRSDRASVETRPYHHGDLENALVELALAQIARSGSMEFTLRGLAREAGVSHMAAYRHFADKTALLARIAELGFSRLLGDLRAAKVTDPAQTLVGQGVAYVRFALSHPGHFRVMWHHVLAERASFPALLTVSQEAYRCIQDTVSRLHGAGLTRAGHTVDDLTTFAWAAVHGTAGLLLEGVIAVGDDTDSDHVVAEVTALVRAAVLA